jgi:hypothetical protein
MRGEIRFLGNNREPAKEPVDWFERGKWLLYGIWIGEIIIVIYLKAR